MTYTMTEGSHEAKVISSGVSTAEAMFAHTWLAGKSKCSENNKNIFQEK